MKKIQLKLPLHQDIQLYLQKNYPSYPHTQILSRSLDARGIQRGKQPQYVYQVELRKEAVGVEKLPQAKCKERPLIIGMGPAGLFCALRLLDYGIKSVLLERGSQANIRMKKIARFWKQGELDESDNVCFGEGGAGLFSDGKLITRVKSPLVKNVMEKMVRFGAPPETAYITDPHLGSNKIRKVLSQITSFLKEQGCELLYQSQVNEILFEKQEVAGVRLSNGQNLTSPYVILASGHSAHDLYEFLAKKQVALSLKDFSVGVRIEHPRSLIDKIQYGPHYQNLIQQLGAARYRLAHNSEDRGTYTFCMCPGGYVLSSGTEKQGLVVNGMSNSARNSPWSNSALVTTVKANHDLTSSILAGLEFQKTIEKKAYEFSYEYASGKELPAQTLEDFLGHVPSKKLPKTSTPSGLVSVNLRELLPDFVCSHLEESLLEFDKKVPGYRSNQALLLAPETRTSAPLRIERDKESLQSLSHQGLYPCGEGAGYAGGITSAAVDGMKVADAIVASGSCSTLRT